MVQETDGPGGITSFKGDLTLMGATPVKTDAVVIPISERRPPVTVAADSPNVTHEPEPEVGPDVHPTGEAPAPKPKGNGGGSVPPIPPQIGRALSAAGGGAMAVARKGWRTVNRGWFQKAILRVLLVVTAVWGLANPFHFSVGGLATWAWSETLFRSGPGVSRLWEQNYMNTAVPLMLTVAVAAILALAAFVYVWRWRTGNAVQMQMFGEALAQRQRKDRAWRKGTGKLLVLMAAGLAIGCGYLFTVRQNLPFVLADFQPWLLALLAFCGWALAAGYTGRTCWRALGTLGRILTAVAAGAILVLLLINFSGTWDWTFIKRYGQFALFVLLMFGLYQAELGLAASGARTVHADIGDDQHLGHHGQAEGNPHADHQTTDTPQQAARH